jgi:hypothetical protein
MSTEVNKLVNEIIIMDRRMRKYWNIKACRIVEARLHIFLISALDKGEYSMFVYISETKEKRGPQGCETSRLPHFLENRLTITVKLSALRPIFLYHRKIPGTCLC